MKKLLVSSIFLLMLGFLTVQQEAQAQEDTTSDGFIKRIDLATTMGFGTAVFNQVGDPGTISVGALSHIYLIEPDFAEPDTAGLLLMLNPGIDWFLFDIPGMSGFQFDANVLLGYGGRRKSLSPYAGLGLAFTLVTGEEEPTTNPGICPPNLPSPCLLSDVESGSNIGLNLIGGFVFGRRSPRVFSELRFTRGGHALHRNDDADPSSGLTYHGGILFFIDD